MINTSYQEQTNHEVLLEEEKLKEIVLHNDDVHSFDEVIEALISICKHEPIQAEQCTMIVHYNGKCAVKRGSYDDLAPICTALLDLGLSAEIQ